MSGEALSSDSWAEVARLRASAEDYARAGDTLAAAIQDSRASQMAERLRKADAGPSLVCSETVGGDPDTAVRLSFAIKVF